MAKYNPKNTGIHKGYPNRKSIRLKGYDYSQAGLYFVTIVTKNREHLFGKIDNGEMILNDAGRMVKNEWLILPKRFTKIQLHEYIVMPNHFHAIMEIVSPNTNVSDQNNITVGTTLVVVPNNETVVPNNETVVPNNETVAPNDKGQPQGIAPTVNSTVNSTNKPTVNPTLGDIVGAFQSIVTVKYIHGVKNHNWKPFDGKLFQRNYWEHIIRNKKAYIKISEYIINNPANWGKDKFK